MSVESAHLPGSCVTCILPIARMGNIESVVCSDKQRKMVNLTLQAPVSALIYIKHEEVFHLISKHREVG